MDFLRSGLRPSLRKSTVFYHKVTAILILFQLAIAICDYISSNGFFEMFVLTDKGNPRACHVYEKLGGKNDFEDEICYVYDFEGDEK